MLGMPGDVQGYLDVADRFCQNLQFGNFYIYIGNFGQNVWQMFVWVSSDNCLNLIYATCGFWVPKHPRGCPDVVHEL